MRNILPRFKINNANELWGLNRIKKHKIKANTIFIIFKKNLKGKFEVQIKINVGKVLYFYKL
jgi:hypothetical protein